jgi:hypothetical protein
MKRLIFIFFLILLLKETVAIGIVTNYLENNTLKLMEGTSTLYEMQIQNTDAEMKVKVGLNSEIAYIIDHKAEYFLPAGVSHTPVYFNITAPLNAKAGDEHVINYYVEPLSTDGGSIQFALRMNKNFKVKIIEDPNKPPPKNYLDGIIIGAILLVMVVVIYIKKYK